MTAERLVTLQKWRIPYSALLARYRLSRLINQVLNFQKIESGKMQWQVEPVDMMQVIQDAVAATRQLAKRQLTWLRSWPEVTAFDCLAADLVAQVTSTVEAVLA